MRYQDLPSAAALARYAAALNARARALPAGGQIGLSELRDVMLSSGGRCEWCGADLVGAPFEIDHIVSLQRGGGHTRANLALSCEDCNRQKGGKAPESFALERLAAGGTQTPLIARVLREAKIPPRAPVQTTLLVDNTHHK